MKQLPYFAKDELGYSTLYVDGMPYMGLGGELKNSSSSNANYMRDKVWPAIEPLGLDTLLLPIAWETIEPVQGDFCFDTLDQIIIQAREKSVRLVLLWFGLWKNGESHYVPLWVKRDKNTYWLAEHSIGGTSYCISPLCEEAVQADARAFAKMMEHLREMDKDHQTVIMVQVENEVGFLGSERDQSAKAVVDFCENIPEPVANAFMRNGNWTEAFGEDAPEFFMAWHYARAIDTIAKAGKHQYALPLFVNAWLEQHPRRPGYYPSGGPIARLIPLWRLGAPNIDAFAPDIYVSDFFGTCQEYAVDNNPLLLPEVRRDPVTASNVFYAFGQKLAVLFSPFGIDEFTDNVDHKPNHKLLTELNIDVESFNCSGTAPYLISSYALLRSARPYLLKNRMRMTGFIKKDQHDRGCVLPMPHCDLLIHYQSDEPGKPSTAGICVQEGADSFLFLGCRFRVEVLPKRNSGKRLAALRLEEGSFRGDEWITGRILNGDERGLLSCGDHASCFRIIVGTI